MLDNVDWMYVCTIWRLCMYWLCNEDYQLRLFLIKHMTNWATLVSFLIITQIAINNILQNTHTALSMKEKYKNVQWKKNILQINEL